MEEITPVAELGEIPTSIKSVKRKWRCHYGTGAEDLKSKDIPENINVFGKDIFSLTAKHGKSA